MFSHAANRGLTHVPSTTLRPWLTSTPPPKKAANGHPLKKIYFPFTQLSKKIFFRLRRDLRTNLELVVKVPG